ncbi:MAG: hypothetical protein JJ863_17735 [Deltaproteobacteria bacterium]|nr:hypothetical protein [Deltaproteobacteria bacterium]
MSDDDGAEAVRLELERLLAPILDAAANRSALRSLLVQLGVNASRLPLDVLDEVGGLVAEIEALSENVPTSLDDLPELLALLEALASLLESCAQLGELFESSTLDVSSERVLKVGERVVPLLIIRYLEGRAPAAVQLLGLIGVLGPREEAALPQELESDDGLFDLPPAVPSFDWSALGAFMMDPPAALRERYWPGALDSEQDAVELSERLGPRLAAVAASFGLRASYGIDPFDVSLRATAGSEEERRRALNLTNPDGSFLIEVAVVPSEVTGGPGVRLTPAGVVSLERRLGDWMLSLAVDGVLPSFLLGADGVSTSGAAAADFTASLARLGVPGEPALTLGSREGSRLDLGWLSLEANLETRGPDFGLAFEAAESAVVLQPSEGDGFLQYVLPADGLEAPFDLSLSWSKLRGLQLAGGIGVEVDIPVGLSLGGVVDLESVYLALQARADELSAALGLTIGVHIGPLDGVVERVGLQLRYRWVDDDGLELAFLPPTGAGFSIDAGVTGGGFLEFDADNDRYAGILALKFGEIGITAIGLITTKMPDGSDGFSMLVNIGVTFDPPIQLSMGFTLSGIGGLIGVNRTMSIDALREGVKNRTLDSILFPEPEWVIPNASKVISDLRSVFPPKEGRFVVGPMVKLGYGSPNFITADIGIFLELFDPIRIVLLGQLSMELPTPEDAIVRINVDIVGVLDFEKKELSFQASLYDSGILSFELFGDAAFFLSWGSKPEFAFSLGGFHPNFTPPPPPTVFADMRRLGLNLSSGSSFQLSCGSYQALTPNSLQFGARADLYAGVSGAEVTGYLSFDTLIYFEPFSFDVAIGAGVTIRYKGSTLADVRVSLNLSGPTPWSAKGTATVKVLFWDIDVDFHKTWGRRDAALPEAKDPWPQLEASLRRAESWGARLPERASLVEALRAVDAEETDGGDAPVVVHPAGTLEIRQNVAPLETTLEKFGNAPVLGHDRFRVQSLAVGETTLPFEPVEEFFARGQFEKLTNAEKLSVPSFERMPGGIRSLSSSTVAASGAPSSTPVGYDSILIRPDLTSETGEDGVTSWVRQKHLLGGNSQKRCALRTQGKARFEHVGGGLVEASEERYVVADAATLVRAELDPRVDRLSTGMTRAQADQALAQHLRFHPADRDALIVVGEYELDEVAA